MSYELSYSFDYSQRPHIIRFIITSTGHREVRKPYSILSPNTQYFNSILMY